MAKYHINAKGVPAVCRARVRPCPLGGESGEENHFNSKEEAQAFADQQNQSEFGNLYIPKKMTEEKRDQLVKDFVMKVAGSIDNVDPFSRNHQLLQNSKYMFENDSEGVGYIVELMEDEDADDWDTRFEIENHMAYYFPKYSADNPNDERYNDRREALNSLAALNIIELKKIMSKTNDEKEIMDHLEKVNIDYIVDRAVPVKKDSITKINANKKTVKEASKVFRTFAENDKFYRYTHSSAEAYEFYERHNGKVKLSPIEKQLAFNMAAHYHENNALRLSITRDNDHQKSIIKKLSKEFEDRFTIVEE